MNPNNLNTHEWETLMDQWYGTGNHNGPYGEPDSGDTCLHLETHQVPMFTSVLTVCKHCEEVMKND